VVWVGREVSVGGACVSVWGREAVGTAKHIPEGTRWKLPRRPGMTQEVAKQDTNLQDFGLAGRAARRRDERRAALRGGFGCRTRD
jgi:hypothetical protein